MSGAHPAILLFVAASAAAVPRLDPALNPAFLHVKAGRFEDARKAAETYLAAPAPAHPGQAEFVIGLSYHQQKLYGRAAEHFERGLALEPDYVTARFFHGFALLNLGRLDAARAELEAYLARAPGEAEARFGLGLVAIEQDRVDDAQREIEAAIALAEGQGPRASTADLARYHARLADVHLRRDRVEPARAELEKSIALNPDHFETWHKLSRVLRRQGDDAGADRAQARSDELFRRRTGQEVP
jgi:tetratricopeptide (TPR) repeat protein